MCHSILKCTVRVCVFVFCWMGVNIQDVWYWRHIHLSIVWMTDLDFWMVWSCAHVVCVCVCWMVMCMCSWCGWYCVCNIDWFFGNFIWFSLIHNFYFKNIKIIVFIKRKSVLQQVRCDFDILICICVNTNCI